MRRAKNLTWILCITTLVTIGVMIGVAEEPTLDVRHRARSVQPGEVVVLEVRPSEPLITVLATTFGLTIELFPDGKDGVWRGLIGVDLEARPDEYSVAVRAKAGSGTTVRSTYTLTVEPKKFATRRLNVSPSYVNPPAEVLGRIQREASRQADIFGTTSSMRQWRGGFLRPVSGQATSSFGRRSVYNGEPRSPHTGTDFRAGEGTPVAAPSAGTVVLADELYFSGNVVIIDHGWGLYSYFAHLSAIAVSEGEVVQSGQIVGKVGATGRVTGPHLHWTVRLRGARVDPLSLMALFPAGQERVK